MTVGGRIRGKRNELNMTLLELSQKIGVREATVQRYESGNIINLKKDTVRRLAEALNTTPTYIMGWDDCVLMIDEDREIMVSENSDVLIAGDGDVPLGYGSDAKTDFWFAGLENTLKRVGYSTGYSTGHYTEDAAMWINYPEGTLGVSNADLEELYTSIEDYIHYKLAELKKKKAQDFKPKSE